MDDNERRKLLRRAALAIDDPEARKVLEAEGVTVGEPQPVDKEALLAEFEESEADRPPSIEVTLYLDETPNREAIEDPLCEYVESSGIGRWVAGGHGSIDELQFFELVFEVTDLSTAVSLVRAKLRALGAGPGTEISASDGTEYTLSFGP